MSANSTARIFKCLQCEGEGPIRMEFMSDIKCIECYGKGTLNEKEFKDQIIRLTSNNLLAIEMIERYELNS